MEIFCLYTIKFLGNDQVFKQYGFYSSKDKATDKIYKTWKNVMLMFEDDVSAAYRIYNDDENDYAFIRRVNVH